MRNSIRYNRSCGCQNNWDKEENMEDSCQHMYCSMTDKDDCGCGFDDEDNRFPTNPMYGQSYIPLQKMNETFTPEVGLKMGTIFPELVSPYCPNQSIEEIEYIRANNNIGEGCNR